MTSYKHQPAPVVRDDIKLCIDIARAFNDSARGSDDDTRFYKTSLMARLAACCSQPIYPAHTPPDMGIRELWGIYEPYSETLPELKAALIACWANILLPENKVSAAAIMLRYHSIMAWQKEDRKAWADIKPSYPDPFDVIVGEVALGQILPN